MSASSLVKDGFAFTSDSESLKLFRNNKLNDLLGYAFLSGDYGKFNALKFKNVSTLNILHPRECSLIKILLCFGIEDWGTSQRIE